MTRIYVNVSMMGMGLNAGTPYAVALTTPLYPCCRIQSHSWNTTVVATIFRTDLVWPMLIVTTRLMLALTHAHVADASGHPSCSILRLRFSAPSPIHFYWHPRSRLSLLEIHQTCCDDLSMVILWRCPPDSKLSSFVLLMRYLINNMEVDSSLEPLYQIRCRERLPKRSCPVMSCTLSSQVGLKCYRGHVCSPETRNCSTDMLPLMAYFLLVLETGPQFGS